MEHLRLARLIVLTLFLTGAALGQTVTLTPTPASLTFNYVIGAALPAAQTIAVKASTGTPTYTTAVIGANSLWLTVSPDAGKFPASLSVRPNPTGLSVGTITATVTITTSTVSASIPVTINVTAPLPVLSVSAATLTFAAPPAQPAQQVIKLSTNGGPISFTVAASGAPWLSVGPASGVVLPGAFLMLTATVDASAVVPQAAAYTGKITISATGVAAANKTQNVLVSLTVNASTPSLATLWPSTAQMNTGPLTVTIRGTNFYAGSVAKIVGITTPLSTTVLSSTAMLAVIPSASLNTAATVNVLVSNPAPGGDSLPLPFLVVATPVVQAVVSAASNGGTSVSPGELVTLYGANIGPTTPATMTDADNDGIIDMALTGVSVSIDGQSAPLLYVSQNQISCQVPYAATVGTARNVIVSNGAVNSTGTVDITATAPGVFTLDGSGTGQAAALNYNATTGNYTLNQSNNPAKLGDIVILYVSGEGDYASSVNPRTGLIVPLSLNPLPQVAPAPTVTIGGASATVLYAGPLVGSIMGLLQINVTVPAGSTTGTAVPVLITIGGVNSQAGTTLSIHQ